MRTSISLGLRVIPPSAGLVSSKVRHALPKVARHIPQQPRQYLSVVRDEELEAEIKKWGAE